MMSIVQPALSDDAKRLLCMLKAVEGAGLKRPVNLRDFDPPWTPDRALTAMRELFDAGLAEPIA
jgi:hypothetical protein